MIRDAEFQTDGERTGRALRRNCEAANAHLGDGCICLACEQMFFDERRVYAGVDAIYLREGLQKTTQRKAFLKISGIIEINQSR